MIQKGKKVLLAVTFFFVFIVCIGARSITVEGFGNTSEEAKSNAKINISSYLNGESINSTTEIKTSDDGKGKTENLFSGYISLKAGGDLFGVTYSSVTETVGAEMQLGKYKVSATIDESMLPIYLAMLEDLKNQIDLIYQIPETNNPVKIQKYTLLLEILQRFDSYKLAAIYLGASYSEIPTFNSPVTTQSIQIALNILSSGDEKESSLTEVFGLKGASEEIKALEEYRIGDVGPAGGFIFYDCDEDNDLEENDGLISSECGWRYLEASPENIDYYVFGYYKPRRNNYKPALVGTSTEIGTGKTNTEALVKAMGNDAYDSFDIKIGENYAAKACYDYNYGGFDDWFLPSRDELEQLYNFFKYETPNDPTYSYEYLGSTYWSSSEYDGYDAWCVRFDFFGEMDGTQRYSDLTLRPIRAF